jgi:hypothetical protein
MVETNTSEGRPRWATAAGLWFFYPLAVLAVLGGRQLRRRRVPLWPLVVPIAITVVVSAAFWGQTRFRAPAEPVLVVLAGTGIAWLMARATNRVLSAEQVVMATSSADKTGDDLAPTAGWRPSSPA